MKKKTSRKRPAVNRIYYIYVGILAILFFTFHTIPFLKRKLSGLPYCILCMVPSVLYAGVYFACKLGLLSLAAS